MDPSIRHLPGQTKTSPPMDARPGAFVPARAIVRPPAAVSVFIPIHGAALRRVCYTEHRQQPIHFFSSQRYLGISFDKQTWRIDQQPNERTAGSRNLGFPWTSDRRQREPGRYDPSFTNDKPATMCQIRNAKYFEGC